LTKAPGSNLLLDSCGPRVHRSPRRLLPLSKKPIAKRRTIFRVPSAFTRLFMYSRAEKARATENFTTEALAASIQSDPYPMLHCLASHGLVRSPEDVLGIDVRTQMGIDSGAGIIDLVMDLSERGSYMSLWIEVKVDAPESGAQLDTYRDHIAKHPAGRHPVLAILGPVPLHRAGQTPWISWQSLWKSIRNSGSAGPYWRDFALFLEEIGMADRDDEPITARESAALGDGYALFRKTRRALLDVDLEASKRWPEVAWPTTESVIERGLWRAFRHHGRLFITVGGSSEAYLLLGIDTLDGESYARVWVEAAQRSVELRGTIIATADANRLPELWERKSAAWGGVQASVRLVALTTHDALVAWYLDRLGELQAAGLFAVVPQLGQVVAGKD
jgi:hypothetical protein